MDHIDGTIYGVYFILCHQ